MMKRLRLLLLGASILLSAATFGQTPVEVDAQAELTVAAAPLQTQVQLFPNPAQKVLKLQVTDYAFETLEVNILDVIGNRVQHLTLQAAPDHNGLHTIDVEKLHGGIYIVEIADPATNQKVTKRFIKG